MVRFDQSQKWAVKLTFTRSVARNLLMMPDLLLNQPIEYNGLGLQYFDVVRFDPTS